MLNQLTARNASGHFADFAVQDHRGDQAVNSLCNASALFPGAALAQVLECGDDDDRGSGRLVA